MTKIYIATLEDHEGCGFPVGLTVHTTRGAAEASFLAMFRDEYGRFEDTDHLHEMTADEAVQWLDEEEGKTGGVTEVELDRMYA